MNRTIDRIEALVRERDAILRDYQRTLESTRVVPDAVAAGNMPMFPLPLPPSHHLYACAYPPTGD